MCPKIFPESCNICRLYEAHNFVLGWEMTHISMSTSTAGSPLRLLSHPWLHLQILASVTAALWDWISASSALTSLSETTGENASDQQVVHKSCFWILLIRADRGELISPTHTHTHKKKNLKKFQSLELWHSLLYSFAKPCDSPCENNAWGTDERASTSPWVKKGAWMIILQFTSIFQVITRCVKPFVVGCPVWASHSVLGICLLQDGSSSNHSKGHIWGSLKDPAGQQYPLGYQVFQRQRWSVAHLSMAFPSKNSVSPRPSFPYVFCYFSLSRKRNNDPFGVGTHWGPKLKDTEQTLGEETQPPLSFSY